MKRAWAGVTAEKEISGIHHHFQEFKNSFMLNEIREMLIQYSIITQRKVNTTEGGSGCDSVGRVFVQIQSTENFYMEHFCFEKTKIMKKRPEWPI